jgi:hypothetical protein
MFRPLAPRLTIVCALFVVGCDRLQDGSNAPRGGPATVQAQTPAAFPLAYSPDRRFLIDSRGVPFPILGRASWLVLSLSRAAYEEYLADTLAKGFNSIELMAISHIPDGSRVPFNGEGNAPFLTRLDGRPWDGKLRYDAIRSEAPDFAAPNPAYWSFVDRFVDYCASKGIAVLMFPAYVGYVGTEEGWMKEMVANGTDRMYAYGAWIARRYHDRNNIVWMLGGDRGTGPNPFSTDELAVERAFVEGLASVPEQGSRHYSAEWAGPLATSEPDFAQYITLDGSYGATTAAYGRRGYSRAPTAATMPVFLLEEPYDEEGPDGNNRNPTYARQPVRRFEWWGWLNSIGGYVAGNGYVWPFQYGPWWRLRPLYKSHLDTRNTTDLRHLNGLIKSIPWYALVPDGLGPAGRLVTAGSGLPDAPDYVAAASTPDGRLLLAYAGPGVRGPFAVAMTVMRGTVTARWFNPTTGEYTPIGTFPNSGSREFVTPGDNGTGYRDWALLLTSP